MTEPTPDPNPKPTFEQRMEGFGRDAEAAGERIGREAEAAAKRIANDGNVVRAADTAARVWGVVVLLVGLWFFADVTLGMDMPRVPWGDIWPIAIILIGLAILFRGMRRQRS